MKNFSDLTFGFSSFFSDRKMLLIYDFYILDTKVSNFLHWQGWNSGDLRDEKSYCYFATLFQQDLHK